MLAARWGWTLVVVTAACGIAQGGVLLAAGVGLLSVAAVENGFPGVNLATLVGALVGAVILSRHPRHPIGWLFCLGQLGVALGLLGSAAAEAILIGAIAPPPAVATLARLVGELLGLQFALVLLGCLLLLAPDGRLLSGRWRPVLLLLVVAYVGTSAILLVLFRPGAARPSGAALNTANAGVIAVAFGLVLSAVSLVVRLRRSRGEARQQLRWIAVAAGLLAVVPVVALAINLTGRPTPVWLIVTLHLAYLGVPVATGMGVLRYRLYDVDRIIGGSVVLAVLLVLAGTGYVVVVGMADTLLQGGRSSTWWPSLVVFVFVVLLFQPIRRWVRLLADRVVHGSQATSYDSLTMLTRRLEDSESDAPFVVAVAEAGARLGAARRCEATLVMPDGSEVGAAWPPDAVVDADGATWVMPVLFHGDEIGRLVLAVPELAAGSLRRRRLLSAFTERAGPAFDHARVESSLRASVASLQEVNRQLVESRKRLLAAKDIGRRQVARTIEADVIEELQPVLRALSHASAEATDHPGAAVGDVDSALEATTRAIDQLREITSTVYSRLLAERGLVEALRAESWRPNRPLTVIGRPVRWPPAVESCLFACCVELIRRGSGPARLEVSDAGGTASVLVSAGLPTESGWLDTVAERVEVLGGRVQQQGHDQLELCIPLSFLDVDAVQPCAAAR